MANIAELVGILSKRVSEQEQKIGLLLSAIVLQNVALKGCKSSKANHAELIAEAEMSVDELLSAAFSAHHVVVSKEADKEAA